MNTLINYALKTHRKYIIKLNGGLLNALLKLRSNKFIGKLFIIIEIINLARKFPNPNDYTIVFNNTKIIQGFREYHRKAHKNVSRMILIDLLLKLLAEKNETDGYYAFLHDEYVMYLLEHGWKPERRGFPMYRYWDTTSLGTDHFTETNPAWIDKRREELLAIREKDRENLNTKISENKLWYCNLELIK